LGLTADCSTGAEALFDALNSGIDVCRRDRQGGDNDDRKEPG